jgi:4-diphosphocytidyl-2-C-methyl-D-erythritol kinase
MVYTIECPAKINLFLNILNRNQNGYHDLQSLFAKIDLFDKLTIEKSSSFELKINSSFDKNFLKNNNILEQIFIYFKDNFNLNSSVKIILDKHIPLGAGLGGGSSDGANFIKILNDIFSLNLPKSQMQKISLKFGSDLPFFFEDGICFIEGRGDKITQLDQQNNQDLIHQLNQCNILLINPRIFLSTPQIFANYNKNISQKKIFYSNKILLNQLIKNNIFDIINNQGNDLEKSAFEVSYELENLFEELNNFPKKCLRMSGSGSSIFMVFNNNIQQKNCQEFLAKKYPNFLVKPIKILN